MTDQEWTDTLTGDGMRLRVPKHVKIEKVPLAALRDLVSQAQEMLNATHEAEMFVVMGWGSEHGAEAGMLLCAGETDREVDDSTMIAWLITATCKALEANGTDPYRFFADFVRDRPL